MKISIIIPVFNTEQYLYQCLDSVLHQTFENLEVIIINDGSTDNSSQIIRQYAEKDSRIVVIEQENQGLSAARNAGIEKASSEYIIFVDSDDYLDLNTCEYIHGEIKNGDSDLLIFGRYRFWDYSNKLVYDNIGSDKSFYRNGKDYLLVHMAKDTFTVSSCNKVFKKEFLKKNFIIFERGILHEDLLFVFKSLLCAHNVKLIEKPFYYYRQLRAGSIVTTIKEKDKDVLLTIELLEQYIRQKEPYLLESKEFKLLIYRWICSVIVFKYPCKSPFSSKANKIVKYVINDKRFNRYMQFVSHSKDIGLKWKVSAWLALHCYPLYVVSIYGLYVVKKKIL